MYEKSIVCTVCGSEFVSADNVPAITMVSEFSDSCIAESWAVGLVVPSIVKVTKTSE